MRKSGLLSWRFPLKTVTLPANSPCRPTESSRSRHGWLKNVSLSVPRPSVISASTIDPRRARIGRRPTLLTFAKTVTSSPGLRSRRSVSLPRSAYRRG
jgi:hypothetical protein